MSTTCTSIPTFTRADRSTFVTTETIVSPSVLTFALSTSYSTSFGCANVIGSCSPTSTVIPSTQFGSTSISVTRTTTLTITNAAVNTFYTTSCFPAAAAAATVTGPPPMMTASNPANNLTVITHVVTSVISSPDGYLTPLRVGTIVAGTVGSIVGIVILGFLFWVGLGWCRRRSGARLLPMPYRYFPMQRQPFAKSMFSGEPSRDTTGNAPVPPPPPYEPLN